MHHLKQVHQLKHLHLLRISDCAAEISETRRKRNADLKDLENTCKQLGRILKQRKRIILITQLLDFFVV
jgi:hypothetical protein